MNVSLNFRQAAYASETERFLIALITLSHPDITEDIRISTDPTARIAEYTTDSEVIYGTVSRGETFLFFPVRLNLPNDTDDGPGEMSIEIDNVHQDYTEIIRELTSPPTLTVELVMDNDLDTVEAQWPDFLLINVRYNATIIAGTLKLETLEQEPYPAGTFNPSYFPGLF